MNNENRGACEARDVQIPPEEFLASGEKMKGKDIEFNTSHFSYKGTIDGILNTNNMVQIIIASPEVRGRFSSNAWRPWHGGTIMNIPVTERDSIWKINNGNKTYVAFSNANNMTIHA